MLSNKEQNIFSKCSLRQCSLPTMQYLNSLLTQTFDGAPVELCPDPSN